MGTFPQDIPGERERGQLTLHPFLLQMRELSDYQEARNLLQVTKLFQMQSCSYKELFRVVSLYHNATLGENPVFIGAVFL